MPVHFQQTREGIPLKNDVDAARADHSAAQDEHFEKLSALDAVQKHLDGLKSAAKRFRRGIDDLGSALASAVNHKPLLPPIAGKVIFALLLVGDVLVSTERLDQLGMEAALTQGIAFSIFCLGFAHVFGKQTAVLRFPEATRYDWFWSGLSFFAVLLTLGGIVFATTPPLSETWPADERADAVTYTVVVYGLLALASAFFAHASTDADPYRKQLRSKIKWEERQLARLTRPIKSAQRDLEEAKREVATTGNTLNARLATLRELEARLESEPETKSQPSRPQLIDGDAA